VVRKCADFDKCNEEAQYFIGGSRLTGIAFYLFSCTVFLADCPLTPGL